MMSIFSNADVTGKQSGSAQFDHFSLSSSLQATWIRNKILLAIKMHDLQASRQLSPNFVYQAPTILGLSHSITNALSIRPEEGADPSVSHIRELQDTVKRFTSSFPARPSNLCPRTSSGDVILLTGTTGGLGANLLAHLTKDPTVYKIYAFNRPSDNVVQRQVDAFSKHGILEDCLRCPKYHLLEGDLSKPFFGLDQLAFEQVSTAEPFHHRFRRSGTYAIFIGSQFCYSHHSQRSVPFLWLYKVLLISFCLDSMACRLQFEYCLFREASSRDT